MSQPGSRRATDALTQKELLFRYEGSCLDNKEAIESSFRASIQSVLEESTGKCPISMSCTLSNITVTCGDRSKRSVANTPRGRVKRDLAGVTTEDAGFMLVVSEEERSSVDGAENHTTTSSTYHVTTQLLTTEGNEQGESYSTTLATSQVVSETTTVRIVFNIESHLKQSQPANKRNQMSLIYSLHDVHDWMKDRVDANTLSLVVTNQTNMTAVVLRTLLEPEYLLNCTQYEFVDDNESRCCECIKTEDGTESRCSKSNEFVVNNESRHC